MAKYRKRPVVIEAFCWDGTEKAVAEMQRICPGLVERSQCSYKGTITFDTTHGPTSYPVGTMIIKDDAKGEVYGLTPEEFADYEYVGE